MRDFYAKIENQLSNSAINWRIYKLVKLGVISRIGRGKFKVGTSSKFKPSLKKKEKSISQQIKKQFPFIDYCIWSSSVTRELAIHQSYNSFIIVETERDSLEAVFQYLKEKYQQVYLKPKRDMVESYLLEMKEPIIVQHLVSEAPLQSIQGIATISIEKLLVDLVHHKDLFYFYQGYELSSIYQQAFDKYTINESTLLRYASRRRKKEAIQEILESINRQ